MLNKKEIENLINDEKLIEGYINLEKQLTPNGFDVTAGEIFKIDSAGCVDFSNKERVLPETTAVEPVKRKEDDKFGWWKLLPGAYKVRTNETVNIPNTLVALGLTRTTLLRMGAFIQNGVWDAGFCGRSEFLLVVQNPNGIEIKQNARVFQLIFFPVDETEHYQGIYKNL